MIKPNTTHCFTVPADARRTIQLLETLRGTCPDAQFILRGLGPKAPGLDDTWPNVYTVVRTLSSFVKLFTQTYKGLTTDAPVCPPLNCAC